MAKPKWNVSSPREYGEGKTFWVNVGSAWSNDRGGKHDVMINLHAMPLPDKDGNVRLYLFPKEDEEESGRRSGRAAREDAEKEKKGARRKPPVDDDEIPF